MSEWDKLAGEAVQFGEQALANKLGVGQDQQGQCAGAAAIPAMSLAKTTVSP